MNNGTSVPARDVVSKPRRERTLSGTMPFRVTMICAGLAVVAILLWQGITAHGNPDPLIAKASPTVAVLDIAVLVFREGLECVLVLAAITASLGGSQKAHRRPIAMGAALGMVATLATWFIARGILQDLSRNISALALQAGTGLLAVLVLLVVMNWFFHKIYWGGWVSMHNRRKKLLLSSQTPSATVQPRIIRGLALLGLASVYREGFEVVLFLQSYTLRLGNLVVLKGATLGLVLTAAVAVMTFVAHQKLPYRRMLVLTGVLLGLVLLVMVGEQAQEMQLAGWISTTPIPWLKPFLPDWAGVWFSLFPTWETLSGQCAAMALVLGSYFYPHLRFGIALNHTPPSRT